MIYCLKTKSLSPLNQTDGLLVLNHGMSKLRHFSKRNVYEMKGKRKFRNTYRHIYKLNCHKWRFSMPVVWLMAVVTFNFPFHRTNDLNLFWPFSLFRNIIKWKFVSYERRQIAMYMHLSRTRFETKFRSNQLEHCTFCNTFYLCIISTRHFDYDSIIIKIAALFCFLHKLSNSVLD